MFCCCLLCSCLFVQVYFSHVVSAHSIYRALRFHSNHREHGYWLTITHFLFLHIIVLHYYIQYYDYYQYYFSFLHILVLHYCIQYYDYYHYYFSFPYYLLLLDIVGAQFQTLESLGDHPPKFMVTQHNTYNTHPQHSPFVHTRGARLTGVV